MQATNAKPIKKSQWLLVLILAPLLADWLGHESPQYAAGNGGLFRYTRHVWTLSSSPMTVTPAAQQKGHGYQDRKQPYAL
ncbi:MAG: hypothetical protein ACYDB0_03700 [Acidithiobacillus sp.]|jgi:hypothetical protein